MRHILVDYAKARNASKRNGGLQIELNEGNHASTDGGIDLIELSEALEKLEEHSETAADALDLRYFGGMTVPEIARLLGLSEASVFRELRFGKAWLLAQLQDTKDSDCDRDTD
jgi:RNA polymerase sigma factor (TIGR02999 family)